MEAKLLYIGNGAALIGVPARDLYEEDIANLARMSKNFARDELVLIASGLYKKVEKEPALKKNRVKKEGE